MSTTYSAKYTGKYFTNVYDREYYSGEQALLYIGDVFVDEIVSYEYSVLENRMPIRGYASRRFDAVTLGTVEVHGQFSINYKESGYLWAILKRYYNLRVGDRGEHAPLYGYRGKSAHDIMRSTYEKLSQLGNKATKDELVSFSYSIAGMLTRNTGGKPFDSVAENIFEEYENMIWGDRSEKSNGKGFIDYSTDPAGIDFRKETDPHWQGFDIWIVHGDYSGSDLKNHTVRKILDVHIVSAQQAADPSGQPILETYTFFARDRV